MLAERESTPDDAPDGLNECRAFAGFLVEAGIISAAQSAEALSLCAARNRDVAALAVELGYMSARQVRIIQAQQRRCEAAFDALALRAGFLTEHTCGALRKRLEERPSIEDALLLLGHAERAALQQAQARFNRRPQRDTTREVVAERSNVEAAVPALRDHFKRLLWQLARLELEFEAGMPWSGEIHFEYQTMITFEGGGASLEFGVGCDHALAAQLVTTMLHLPIEDCDDELMQSAVSEFANMLAGQSQRHVCGDVSARISLPRPGELPHSGLFLPLVTPLGEGGLVVGF